jgi:hypothetical protein
VALGFAACVKDQSREWCSKTAHLMKEEREKKREEKRGGAGVPAAPSRAHPNVLAS